MADPAGPGVESSSEQTPPAPIHDDRIELRLLRVLGPADVDSRPPQTRFLARAAEHRFAIHRRSDGARVGRIHFRITDDPGIVGVLGHGGYEIDEAYRRMGYATRAVVLIRRVARSHGVAPLWILIAPENEASRRTAERAGLRLVDIVAASPVAVSLGLGPQLCRYVVDQP